MKPTAVAAFAIAFQQLIAGLGVHAQASQALSAAQIVNEMVQAETAAWKDRQHFLYRSEERSNRTNGQLWEELVVETPDGSMQRLISEDGKPLSEGEN